MCHCSLFGISVAHDFPSAFSLSKNHTLTQSTFASPCTNFSDNGLDSGFQFVPNNTDTIMQYSFNMTNVTGPLWFYCRQAGYVPFRPPPNMCLISRIDTARRAWSSP